VADGGLGGLAFGAVTQLAALATAGVHVVHPAPPLPLLAIMRRHGLRRKADCCTVSHGETTGPGMQVKSINALARGLEVLQLLQSSGALTLADLHRLTGIPKASLLRILKTLMEGGFIWQRMADAAWVPSWSLGEMAGRIDHEHRLVEVASPVLAALTARIEWPSVLAVPRLTHMEVLETNAARAYFDGIALGPVGFQVNMLRSASGRAFIAFCAAPVRDAILETLRRSDRPGNRAARNPAYVKALLAETRTQGFGLRDPDFGGDFDVGRAVADDGRESLGVPIRLGNHVPGTLNITWTRRVLRRDQAVALLVPPALQAAQEIARQLGRAVSPDEIPPAAD
jgi:IclR family transcriptional regulator, mhp operon transcriptional activator